MATVTRNLYAIYHAHGPFLARVSQGHDPFDDATIGPLYAERLKEEVQPQLRVGEVETHPRYPTETGGPGIEFDPVAVMFAASALLGTYAGFRQIVIDLRTVASRLRELGDGRILIDEHTAEVLARDHAATAETFADIEPRFCAKVRGFDDDDPAPDRGYVVGLTVNWADKLVVIGADGSILGMTNDVTIDGLDRLGI